MLKKAAFALIVLALLISGCAVATQSARQAEAPSVVTSLESAGSAPAAQPLPEVNKSAYALDQTATSVDRLVIKNANLSMSVEDPQKSMDNISKMAESMGGYVVSAEMYQQTLDNGTKVPQVNITIRVPAERLAEALATIKAETTQPVISENETSQDVTADYTDLDSRLRNLEAAEKQLQNILDQATKTQDVLDVFNQLTQVREQIEVIKGQMKYYSESAALSAVSVELMANAAVQPLTIGGWQPVGVARQALQALINTLRVLANIAIWLVIVVIPVLAIIVLPPFFVIRYFVRRRARRKALVQAPPPPASE